MQFRIKVKDNNTQKGSIFENYVLELDVRKLLDHAVLLTRFS